MTITKLSESLDSASHAQILWGACKTALEEMPHSVGASSNNSHVRPEAFTDRSKPGHQLNIAKRCPHLETMVICAITAIYSLG